MSATALSRINSHRAAEQMIHVVIPIRIESAISSNHQLEDAIVFFYVHMFNWVSSFLD